jgi:hypothetical protein
MSSAGSLLAMVVSFLFLIASSSYALVNAKDEKMSQSIQQTNRIQLDERAES